MKNRLIKILGGYTEQDLDAHKEESRLSGIKEGKLSIYNVICSQSCSVKEDRLGYMSGFIDYICVTVGIPKKYNNGNYEKFIKEM